MQLSADQAAEVAKYDLAYRSPRYCMGTARHAAAVSALATLGGGSMLDVGCGRGEMLAAARSIGFAPVHGVEAVADLCGDNVTQAPAWALPFADDAFDVVTCFDVLEHLLADDGIAALREFRRVARRHVVLTAANFPSVYNGHDLHITKRPYAEWDQLIRLHVGDAAWLPRVHGTPSETWVVTL